MCDRLHFLCLLLGLFYEIYQEYVWSLTRSSLICFIVQLFVHATLFNSSMSGYIILASTQIRGSLAIRGVFYSIIFISTSCMSELNELLGEMSCNYYCVSFVLVVKVIFDFLVVVNSFQLLFYHCHRTIHQL